ncbi:hypothetical protein XA68_14096 [Ophiocordyceps unilateralis]|uniref:Peptidase S8/S53 domain-containing protein n=1 Tax=Ophiocordyceps unilateralis TaxID=268505 RepID=A0A2A9PAB5_OPHUN|nr:hypothetical protein XA68_14096 [Ophiocordyceps unilateralis]
MNCLTTVMAATAAWWAVVTGFVVPNAFLVEVQEGYSLNDLVESFEEKGVGEIHRKMDQTLFQGISVQLHETDNQTAGSQLLRSLKGAGSMVPIEEHQVIHDTPAGSVREYKAFKTPGQGSPSIVRRDSQVTAPADALPAHVMAQVDRLHAEGITGRGYRIAVIDTGIDYTHPALGGQFGPGNLVSFGADFYGDDSQGGRPPFSLLPTPMDCNGHGTNVAGILAAQRDKNAFDFSGVAPGVTLGAYRIYGCQIVSTLRTDHFIAAINQAYDDGADIITVSLGAMSGWPDDHISAAVSRIVEKGVPCVAAVGNDGLTGPFGTSSPANGKGVLSIAHFTTTAATAFTWRAFYSVDNGTETAFEYRFASDQEMWCEDVSFQLYAPDVGEACDSLPYSAPELYGRDIIILVRDGVCPAAQQAAVVGRWLGRFVIVYSDAEELPDLVGNVAVAMVPTKVGELWSRLLNQGSKITVKMQADAMETSPIKMADGGSSVHDTSSWGPGWNLHVKPQFGAPGSYMPTLSTNGGYVIRTGASLAAPFAAGVVALVAQVRHHNNLDPLLIETLLSTTARPQRYHDGKRMSDSLAPTAQQGAGLIQAYDAAHTSTIVEPPSLSFNDTEHHVPSHELTITNEGTTTITYNMSYTPAITVYTMMQSSPELTSFPPEAMEGSAASASVQVSDSMVSIAPGASAVINVSASPPRGLDASRLPLWSGFLVINGSDGSSLSVPYQGLVGSLNKHPTLLADSAKIATGFQPQSLVHPVSWASEGQTFSIKQNSVESESRTVLTLVVAPNLGISDLHVNIIFNPFLEAQSLGKPRGLMARWLPRRTIERSLYAFEWDGSLENGNTVPEGLYQFHVSAPRIFGNPANETEYDYCKTITFRIVHE